MEIQPNPPYFSRKATFKSEQRSPTNARRSDRGHPTARNRQLFTKPPQGVASMDSNTNTFDLLMELESRHEDLLMRLDELDKRVEKTLQECQCLRIRPNNETPSLKAG
jgi:hypothetical protein